MRLVLAGIAWMAMALAAIAEPIPLEKGLVLVYEGYDPGGGPNHPAGYIERLVTVVDKTADQLTLQVQFNDYVGDKDNAVTVTKNRVMREEDFENAHRLIGIYLSGDPDMLPGNIYFHASKAMMNDLGSGTTKFVYGAPPPEEYGGFFTVGNRKYYRGDLKVTEPHVTMDALIDGAQTKLDAMHTAGTFTVAELQVSQDFWFLNDPDNPLILRWQGSRGNYIQLVRADVLAAAPEKKAVTSAVETALAGKDCRATLPGIYFGTGSAILLPASQSALQQIGQVLAQHKDWQITIEGHTDNVGTDDYNLDLSNRRAAAIKDALVSQFAADATHLETKGFGETRPVQTNDTPVGRAANRRVEMVRDCH